MFKRTVRRVAGECSPGQANQRWNRQFSLCDKTQQNEISLYEYFTKIKNK